MILPDSRFVLPCPRMLLTDEKCERERERERALLGTISITEWCMKFTAYTVQRVSDATVYITDQLGLCHCLLGIYDWCRRIGNARPCTL